MRWFLMLMIAGAALQGSAQQPAAAARKPVPLTTFTDATTGVSFRYPSVWKRVAQPDTMTQPFLLMAGYKPILDVEFSPQGNLYEKTNLVGLDFSYYTAPAESQAACAKLGNIQEGDGAPVSSTIHGMTYSHSSGGEGGMCHEISSDVYATWRAGTCYLFEEDFMTICPGVVEGTRGLTAQETRALQRHLDQIMQSVTFAAPQ